MTRTHAAFALAVLCAWLLGGHTAWAQKEGDAEHAQVARALNGARASLQKGLSASEREGKPISGKFEVEEGKLQLSVYTMKGDTFSEVIVDPRTGKVVKVGAITSGDDLATARTQSEAMARAKTSLRAATNTAVKANKGFRAVSIMPALKDGRPVADITLARGDAFKTVSEKLD